jgi:hypothetical protein
VDEMATLTSTEMLGENDGSVEMDFDFWENTENNF